MSTFALRWCQSTPPLQAWAGLTVRAWFHWGSKLERDRRGEIARCSCNPRYSRGIGNDFPRIAYRRATDTDDDQIIVVWNDASLHPLGDIWMRALTLGLNFATRIQKVNDDSRFALHFLPAVSVREDGSIATSWYDRGLSGADGVLTDYFGEVRAAADENSVDFRITTASTNWLGTGSLISPNFGDYTDNNSTGTTTYFNWTDGRLGIPQPFVDSSDNVAP